VFCKVQQTWAKDPKHGDGVFETSRQKARLRRPVRQVKRVPRGALR